MERAALGVKAPVIVHGSSTLFNIGPRVWPGCRHLGQFQNGNDARDAIPGIFAKSAHPAERIGDVLRSCAKERKRVKQERTEPAEGGMAQRGHARKYHEACPYTNTVNMGFVS